MSQRQYVIFAPDVPADVRALLGANPRHCLRYDQPAGKGAPIGRKVLAATWNGAYRLCYGVQHAWPVGLIGMLTGFALTYAGAVAGAPDGLGEVLVPSGLVLGSALGGFAGVRIPDADAKDENGELRYPGLVDAPYQKVNRLAVKYHRRYVQPLDLDEQGRVLLDRAHRAVGAVLAAEVTRAGLLDRVANRVVLPDELWQIAELLHRHSVLRIEQAGTDHLPRTPELEAVRGPQRRALEVSVKAVTARVEALEAYADRVGLADSVYAAQSIAANNEAYIELLAHSPDESALAALTADVASLQLRLEEAVEAGLGIGG